MKRSRRCPKCQSTKLFYVADVAANMDTGTMQMQPTMRLAVTGKGRNGRSGELEAYACSGCGFTEFYLKKLLTPDGIHVKLLDSDSSSGK